MLEEAGVPGAAAPPGMEMLGWHLGLALAAGELLPCRLLHQVWWIGHDPGTNSVEVHVSRLRTKLAGAGCSHPVETAATGGYRLRCAAKDAPTDCHARPAGR